MTEDEAAREATRRNGELSEAERNAGDYWIETQDADGAWTVTRRREKRSLLRKLWEGIVASPGP